MSAGPDQTHPTGRPAHRARSAAQAFPAEVRDAVTGRTVVLVLGVLLLELAFVLSYVGAFHAPRPHRITVATVGPARVVSELDGLPSQPLRATTAPSEAAARDETVAAFVVHPTSTTDTLLVASGGGAALVTAVQEVLTRADAAQHRTVAVSDIAPLQGGDNRGLTGFYLVTGWTVGGYLMAALLGVARGARPATGQRALIRILAVVPYAVVSGIGGATIVGPVLGALTGHFWAVAALGALVVVVAATVTMAFQVLLGVLGVGAAVLLFVVLGNPSAGGAYQAPLLPAFWRTISTALPNGAATDTVRRIVYFGGHGITGHLVVLAVWAAAGVVVALLTSRRPRRVATGTPTGPVPLARTVTPAD